MTRRPSQIFVGDYVRAVKGLDADDEQTRRAIAQCLGLFEDEAPRAAVEPPEKKKDDDKEKPPEESTEKKQNGEKAKTPLTVEGGKVVESGLEMISTGTLPTSAPDWLGLRESLRATVATTAAAANDPAPEPLLAPGWVRGILTALLSTRSIDGPPDIERAVEAIARKELVTELPRLHSLTTRRGVQLLIDMGDGMLPFGRDQSGLMRDVFNVIGEEAASVLRFTGTPLRGAGTGSRRRWTTYEPPLAGTPVLLLTDLGIGQPAGATLAAPVEEWLDFAELLRRADCPAVALIPYPSARWPAPLARVIHLIEWDRPTSVANARRLVGRGLEVKR